MSWIVIAVIVLLAAFGPVMWLRPSAKDKRLTALRARARSLDLNVDIRPLERLNPTAEQRVSAAGTERDTSELLAVYEHHLARRLRHTAPFRLFRAPGPDAAPVTRAAVPVTDGWLFDPAASFPPEAGWPAALSAVERHLPSLPQDVRALAVEPRSVGVYWAERAGSDIEAVDNLAQALTAMGQALAAADDRRDDADSDINS
jgi:hypothetical protein